MLNIFTLFLHEIRFLLLLKRNQCSTWMVLVLNLVLHQGTGQMMVEVMAYCMFTDNRITGLHLNNLMITLQRIYCLSHHAGESTNDVDYTNINSRMSDSSHWPKKDSEEGYIILGSGKSYLSDERVIAGTLQFVSCLLVLTK